MRRPAIRKGRERGGLMMAIVIALVCLVIVAGVQYVISSTGPPTWTGGVFRRSTRRGWS